MHIIELDDRTGSYAFENSLVCQDSGVEEASITPYALSGTPTSGTMRVRGKVQHKFLIILIDSSSTHNFVDIALFS